MSKVRKVAEITANIPFTEFNFYDLYRSTFEKSEMGRMKKLLRLSFVRIIALQFSRESKIGLALSIDIDVSVLQRIKASSCSSSTLAGINMDCRLQHPSNALGPIFLRPSVNSISFRFVHSKKAASSI